MPSLLSTHPGLSKIPAWAGGPGSDIINSGIAIGGQKLGAGWFLIPRAGRGLTCCLPKFASAFKHVQWKQVQGLLHEMQPTLVCATASCFLIKMNGALYPYYDVTSPSLRRNFDNPG